MQSENVIWKYWETRGEKPKYIDGLHEIAERNSGVKIVLVTPDTLRDYLPDIEDEIFQIQDMAHKADMIRTRLVMRYGGMWLDSDAVVLSDLNWLFEHLKISEFVGFNNAGRLQTERPWVRVNCFLSRPNGRIVSQWVAEQRTKFPRTMFGWSEIGAQILNAVCLQNSALAKILPFENICPIGPKKVETFMTKNDPLAARILAECFIVMLSNRSLQIRSIPLQNLTVEEIAAGETVIARILQRALDPGHPVPLDTEPRVQLVRVETVHGPIVAFENDFITDQIRKFGAHTRTEIALLLSAVRQGDFIFDLGAHIGTYAIPLARKAGGMGKLLAIEGSQETFRVLKCNLANAHLDASITALNALVGRSGQRYDAHKPEGNTGGTVFVPSEDGGVSAPVATIDELCRRYFVPRLIKIDIEGGEFSALSDAHVLRRECPIIYTEVNRQLLQRQGSSIIAMAELLHANGYRLFRNIGERHAAHDNFVVAELEALPTNLNNFDVLAIHGSDERLEPFVEAAARRADPVGARN